MPSTHSQYLIKPLLIVPDIQSVHSTNSKDTTRFRSEIMSGSYTCNISWLILHLQLPVSYIDQSPAKLENVFHEFYVNIFCLKDSFLASMKT